MSYRCDICGIKVPHGRQRLVHPVRYPRTANLHPNLRGQVKQELSCCEGCHLMLDEVPLASVKDPYYIRPKHGDRTTVIAEYVPPAAPATDEIGRPARTATL